MIFVIFIAILLIVIDQFSKLYFAAYFSSNNIIDLPIIQNVLHLVYTENKGAAFGILQNARIFFIIVTVLFCIGYIIWLKRQPKLHIFLKISSAFVMGGAIGNLIDRVFLAYVRDFIDFRFLQRFAIFNIADSCVVVGTILLCFYLFFIHDKYVGITKIHKNEQQ